MGRQRNNPQLKGKKESLEGVKNEIESKKLSTKLSDMKYSIMVIRTIVLKELSKNIKELQGSFRKLLRTTSA